MKIARIYSEISALCESQFVAKELMKFYFKMSFEDIFLRFNDEISQYNEILALAKRYKNGEPLEYIIGFCEFMGLKFSVKKGVLIARSETEILVEKTLEIAKKFQNPKICEIGFGSGIIAILLATKLKNAAVVATDISKIAFEIATQNAKNHGVSVKFIQTSLLDGIDENFDIIVSNPPYISKSYKLDKWVLNEPKEALIGGENGDEMLCKIIEISSKRAKFLLCEIGFDQKNSLAKTLDKFGYEAKFYKDLAGFDRGFVAKLKEKK